MMTSKLTLSQLLSSLGDIPILTLALFFTLTFSIIVLTYIQFKKDTLDLRWLILDDISARPSIHKIGQMLALLVSTWGFVYQMLHNTFSDNYLLVYMGVWAGAGAVDKFLSNKSPTGTVTTQQIFTQTKETPNEETSVVQSATETSRP